MYRKTSQDAGVLVDGLLDPLQLGIIVAIVALVIVAGRFFRSNT